MCHVRDIRQDGLENCLTGLGEIDRDTRTSTRRTPARQRSVYDLEQEWQQNWMAYREASQLPWDMFREGFTLTGYVPEDLDIGAIMSAVEGDMAIGLGGEIDQSAGLLHYAWQLREQGDKFGGAVLFAIVDDGLDPIEPLDVRRIQRIVGWEVLDRGEITPWWGRAGYNAAPEYYILSDVLAPPASGQAWKPLQAGAVIHASRLMVHRGQTLSRRAMRNRQWWGASVLERCERERRGVEEGTEYARTYADRASWMHVGIAGLNEMMGAQDADGNPIGEAMLATRLGQMRKHCRTLGIGFTDAGTPTTTDRNGKVHPGRNADTLASIQESSGNLESLVRLDLDQWQMGAGMPKSIAFGETPSGLHGGDNSGDWQSWQGTVRTQQNLWATPVLNWMLTLLFKSREGPTRGALPEQWMIDWNPLLVPSPKEVAEIAKLQADADEVRIRSLVAKADEVRTQRLINGDTDGPLTAPPPDDTIVDETGVGPALVGIATATLDGAVKVAAGEMPEAAFAIWLTSIDEVRYPPEKAAAYAAASAAGRIPAEIVAEAELEATVPTEDASGAEHPAPEPDEAEVAFSTDPRPTDLMPAAEIKAKLAEIQVSVSTRKITNLAREGRIRTWDNLGKLVHSFGEVRRMGESIDHAMRVRLVAEHHRLFAPAFGRPVCDPLALQDLAL